MTKRLNSASVDTETPSRRLWHAIVSRWRAGELPDARAAMHAHPKLATVKSLVVDLAYEEYCLRLDAGETIDRDEFCSRFPAFRLSLCRRLEVHDFLLDDGLPSSGETLFGLTLVEELGRGALGCVFLARESALGDRLVAVKFARTGQYEASLLGRLLHPNIVPVHSVKYDPATGWSAVVMPYLGRHTMADLLDAAFSEQQAPKSMPAVITRLPDLAEARSRHTDYLDSVLDFVAQLADALAYTHAQSIVHRDIKPSNVLFTSDLRPMLLDFNLSTDVSSQNRRVGGTAMYMAPEQLAQIAGEQTGVDGRADIYSLGLVLYELLTGKHPFLGSVDIAERQRNFHPSTAPLDAGIIRILSCCVAYRAEDRFDSAAELANALRRQLRFDYRAGRWSRRHPRRCVAAAAAACTLIALTGYSYANRPTYVERERAAATTMYSAGEYEAAIDHLQNVIEVEPDSAEAHYLLGRARVAIGRLDPAYENFLRAYELSKDGRSAACVGYLSNVVGSGSVPALVWYQRAQDAGFRSAEMQNNIGYSMRQQGDSAGARNHFVAALEEKSNMTTAILNLAVNELQQAVKTNQVVGEPILRIFDRAIHTCPPSAALYLAAATAAARSDLPEPARTDRVVAHLKRAFDCGLSRTLAFTDPYLERFEHHPDLQPLLNKPAPMRVPPIYLSDPLGEFGAKYASKYD